MRIISGKFRNKKLYFPKNLKTRPLKDSVRENIFNILEHSNNIEIKIKNSSIVDLSLTNVVGDNMGKVSAWYDN